MSLMVTISWKMILNTQCIDQLSVVDPWKDLLIKPAHKNIEMIDQCLRNKPLQGATSFILHKWTILRWHKWQDLLSIYRVLRGHNIIRADITIIM